MITLDQFQDILAGSLFGGDAAVAGIVIFSITLAVIFVLLNRNTFAALLLSIPTAFVYSLLGILSTEMMAILIVISVIGMATVSKRTLGD